MICVIPMTMMIAGLMQFREAEPATRALSIAFLYLIVLPICVFKLLYKIAVGHSRKAGISASLVSCAGRARGRIRALKA